MSDQADPQIEEMVKQWAYQVTTLRTADRMRNALEHERQQEVIMRQRHEVHRLEQENRQLHADLAAVRAANGAAVLQYAEVRRVLEQVREVSMINTLRATIDAVLDAQHPGATLKAEIEAMQAELETLRAAQQQEAPHA